MAERESSWSPAMASLGREHHQGRHCYSTFPLKGLPQVTESLSAAVQLPLGWTMRQHLQKSGGEWRISAQMGSLVHKAMSQTLWYSHKNRA